MRIAVVGAGFAGLAAAYDLAVDHQVEVFEGGSVPGGLAAGFRDDSWEWPLEHFYHHLFTSDDAILGLARETGFGDRVITRRPITANWYDGKIFALDGVRPVLAFSLIPIADRLRMGMAIAYLKVTRDWRSLEHVTAVDWLRRWMGDRVLEQVWRPLLMGKFGAYHDQVPMSWLWARLHKRSMHLVYFAGGFQAFADHLAAAAVARGATIRYSSSVERIQSTGNTLELQAGGRSESFDRVIVTTGPHLLAKVTEGLPPEYLRGLGQLSHLGAIVVVLALKHGVMDDVYWLSLDKRVFPFLALVEHTNFMDATHYGGDVLVYLGDYRRTDDAAFGMSDEEILAQWLPALTKVNPDFDPSWVRRSWVFRAAYAQPVVPLGFSQHIPPLETPISGLFLASMSQVYPWDRGTNYAVEIGRRAAAAASG